MISHSFRVVSTLVYQQHRGMFLLPLLMGSTNLPCESHAALIQAAAILVRFCEYSLVFFFTHNLSTGIDSFVSPSIYGLIDREAPTKLVQGLLPANGKYLLGDEISATFSEDISCTKPYSFDVSMDLGTTPKQMLMNSNLSLYCEGRKIFVDFSPRSNHRVRHFLPMFTPT
jgi:hypothetical protein